MAQSAPVRAKIPTKNPQPSRAGVTRPAATAARPRRTGRSAFAAGTGRAVTRGDGRVVVEVEGGITVYPARRAGDRWRAVWYEGGRRRQCEAVAEDKLAAKLARVAERLQADAPGLERPGADLIAWYLSPDRHPAGRPWSRKHADTQRRLCERFIAPVIAAVCCQDIRVADMQRIVNAAPTAGEGARLRRCLSAMVTAGIAAGYLTSPRLKEVHWQAAGRAAPGPQVAIAGESALFVDPAEIPADHDVARLGQALARGRRGDLAELMANTAAYTGLRQGELFALTAGQVAPAARVITVDRKVVEVAGTLYLEAPKGRKRRSTIYPARTPAGYPLADAIAARIQAGPGRAGRRRQPARADVPLPPRHLVAVLQLRPPRPGPRLPGRRLARPRRHRRLDLAQPAARVLHHRPVRLAPRTRRRLLHGRPRHRPRHPRHVRRRHRRHPGPRPHRHPIAPCRPLLRKVTVPGYRGRTGRAKRRLRIFGQGGQMRPRLRAYLSVRVAWPVGLPGQGFRTGHCARCGRARQVRRRFAVVSSRSSDAAQSGRCVAACREWPRMARQKTANKPGGRV